MKKKDDNHNSILGVFRDCGARILETYMIPNSGCDFIALLNQRLYVIEVKDGSKPPSKQKLTTNEKNAQIYWGDNYYVINSVLQAINIIQCLLQGGQFNNYSQNIYKAYEGG